MQSTDLKTGLLAVLIAGAFLSGWMGFLYLAAPPGQTIVVASTTSTKDSGLFGYLLPHLRKKTGIVVVVASVGTGEALDIARRGDADVILVHAKVLEQQFISEGYGVQRYPLMYNDYVLIGPKGDPAGIRGMTDIAQALRTIRDKQARFVSRADASGTHLAELALWHNEAGINIHKEGGVWYRPVALGMKATLQVARDTDGYVLSDRGTWLSLAENGN